MPLCPTCGYEYIEGIQRCPDCDEVLVDQPPEEDLGKESHRVKLHTFPGEVYADMVGEVLEREGIPYLVEKEAIYSLAIVQGTTEGRGVTLYVNEEDFERADAIMNRMMDHI